MSSGAGQPCLASYCLCSNAASIIGRLSKMSKTSKQSSSWCVEDCQRWNEGCFVQDQKKSKYQQKSEGAFLVRHRQMMVVDKQLDAGKAPPHAMRLSVHCFTHGSKGKKTIILSHGLFLIMRSYVH